MADGPKSLRIVAVPSLSAHHGGVVLPREVAAHLDWMAQRGRAATTAYDRERLLARLAAWLDCYRDGNETGRASLRSPDNAGTNGIPGRHASSRLGACSRLPQPRPGQTQSGLPDNAAGPGLLAATPAELAAWRASLTCSPGGVCVSVSHASCFYAWAVAQGLIGANPAAGLPVPRRPRRLPRPIPTAELMDAVATAPRRIRPWLVLAAWAGLRAKEVALLRAECLMLAGSPVAIVASDATKGTHERTVPLSDFAVAELRAHGVPRRGWVFLREDGRAGPNSPHRVSALVNEHLRACGSGATMHQLRHWFLTAAYQESLDIRLVQELAGHRSPETTAGYAAVSNARAAAVVNALPSPKRLRAVSGT